MSVSLIDGHVDRDKKPMTFEDVKRIRENPTAEDIDIAIEKQIPKKATPHIVDVEKLKIGNANWCKNTTVYKCPCCNNFVSRLYEFCFKCEQALDWSDTE